MNFPHKKFNLIYQITNKINGKIYIGCRQTNKINEGYMGSGLLIKRAIKKYGKENFEKLILENFETPEEMFQKERELVNESFIKRRDNYNISVGGNGGFGPYIPVKDKNGNIFCVFNNDPRYLSGELTSINHNTVVVKDKHGNSYRMNKTDPRYLSGKFKGVTYQTVIIKDKNGKYYPITMEEYRKNKNSYFPIWKGRKHTEETKRKIGKATSKAQKGKGNSQYGTCWIHKEELKKSKKIKKENLNTWIKKGWIKGRKTFFT